MNKSSVKKFSKGLEIGAPIGVCIAVTMIILNNESIKTVNLALLIPIMIAYYFLFKNFFRQVKDEK